MCESKMIPRFLAESEGRMSGVDSRTREAFDILESCCFKPINMNSVLDGLRASRLENIQEEMEENSFLKLSDSDREGVRNKGYG